MQEPTAFPEWASDPPVAPPTTIVEPSQPEKEEGFPPGSQAQVVDFTFVVVNSHAYNTRINGVNGNYTSDGTATGTEVRNNVRDAINANGEPVTAINTGSAVRVTADVPGQSFTYGTTDGANVTATLVTANRSGKPTRQYVNWLFNLIWKWIVVLWQFTHRTDDMHPDFALPGGDPPSTGSGFLITAGDFSARVYAAGREVPLTSFPAAGDTYTYSATRDTYWDLGVDREWTAAVVPAGDPAPAVTSDSVRCYKVTTNGSNRTALVSYLASTIRFDAALDLENNVRFGEGLRGSAAAFATARRTTRFDNLGTGYTTIDSWTDDEASPGIGTRLLIRHATRTPVIVRGANFNGTTWDVDSGATDVEMRSLRNSPCFCSVIIPSGSPFADSEWFADMTDGGNIVKLTNEQGSIAAGQDLDNNNFEKMEVARFEAIPASTGVRGLMAKLSSWFRLYSLHTASNGTASVGYGGEIATNCYQRASDGLWVRISAGPSFKLELASEGLRLYRHPAGGSATWADTVSAGTWFLAVEFDENGLSTFTDTIQAGNGILCTGGGVLAGPGIFDDISVNATLTVSGSTETETLEVNDANGSAANTLYAGGIKKAWAVVTTDGGGPTGAIDTDPAKTRYYKCSAVITGADLVVTLDHAMDGAYWPRSKPFGDDTFTRETIIDDTNFSVALYNRATGTHLNLTTEVVAHVIGLDVEGYHA